MQMDLEYIMRAVSIIAVCVASVRLTDEPGGQEALRRFSVRIRIDYSWTAGRTDPS